VVKPIRQRNTGTLVRMSIGIYRNLDAGMPQLLRDVLDGGMVLIQLDRGVTMPEIVNPREAQVCPSTDTSMDRREPGCGPRPAVGPTKDELRDGRLPLENGIIKTLVPKLQERCAEFVRHIHASTATIFGGIEYLVGWIIGPLDMQKAMSIISVLPPLDVIPVQP